MADAEHGFKEGDPVWVEDGDGKHHPGVFVGDNESSGWFGGGPSAYVAHPEAFNYPRTVEYGGGYLWMGDNGNAVIQYQLDGTFVNRTPRTAHSPLSS